MRIESTAGDDDRYIEIVRGVVEVVVRRDSPARLRIVRIDNWFGEKWRGFAGKVLGAFGVSRGRLVIPPFVPSRVESECSWTKGESEYVLDPDSDVLHKRIRSEGNLRRYFDQHCPGTIAVWFSSKSASNGRGSIMVYSDVGMEQTVSWYVELTEARNWETSVANGITTSEFLKLVGSSQTEAEPDANDQAAAAAQSRPWGQVRPSTRSRGRDPCNGWNRFDVA
jgi:hypothetical protein